MITSIEKGFKAAIMSKKFDKRPRYYRVTMADANGELVYRSEPFDSKHEAQIFANDVAAANRDYKVLVVLCALPPVKNQ